MRIILQKSIVFLTTLLPVLLGGFAKENGTTFVILYFGQQGSTWLVEELSMFRGICMIGNELIDRVKDPAKRMEFISMSMQRQKSKEEFVVWRRKLLRFLPDEEASYLDHLRLDACTGKELVRGFKARLKDSEMEKLLRMPGNIRLIFLQRNPLKQAMSRYRTGEGRGQRAVNRAVRGVRDCMRGTEQKQQNAKVNCSDAFATLAATRTKSFLNFTTYRKLLVPVLNEYKRIDRLLELHKITMWQSDVHISPGTATRQSSSPTAALLLSYEEMLSNMSWTLSSRVLPFVGISHENAEIDKTKRTRLFTEKATQPELCDAIENFSEFCTDLSVFTVERRDFSFPSSSKRPKSLIKFADPFDCSTRKNLVTQCCNQKC